MQQKKPRSLFIGYLVIQLVLVTGNTLVRILQDIGNPMSYPLFRLFQLGSLLLGAAAVGGAFSVTPSVKKGFSVLGILAGLQLAGGYYSVLLESAVYDTPLSASPFVQTTFFAALYAAMFLFLPYALALLFLRREGRAARSLFDLRAPKPAAAATAAGVVTVWRLITLISDIATLVQSSFGYYTKSEIFYVALDILLLIGGALLTYLVILWTDRFVRQA